MGQWDPKHVGVLKIKTLECVHFVDQIFNSYFTMHAVKNVKKKKNCFHMPDTCIYTHWRNIEEVR